MHRRRFPALPLPKPALWIAFALLAPALTGNPSAATTGESWEEVAGLQVLHAEENLSLARIFDSPDFLHQLVVPGAGEEAFVLDLKARSVAALPIAAITWTEDSLPVPDLAQAVDLGAFHNDEGIVSFDGDGGLYTIQPEPPLVGPISMEKFRAAKPDYVHAAAKYAPDAASVEALTKVKSPTRIVVFFGTWCSYCKKWLPHLMKTVEAAQNPALQLEFVGMSEDQSEPADLLREHDISLTPSFVVLQGGKELGRFEEEPLLSVEADLARILKVK